MYPSIQDINFEKDNGLIPAIIQDASTQKVLMLGYMNSDAYQQTINTGKVTFYSRSKQRLWVKGETSNNYLTLESIRLDCDQDALLVHATPAGPTCHTGADTCFKEENTGSFLDTLEQIIAERKANPSEASYTASLFKKGTHKIAQKVGEEAVELVIESLMKDDNLFKNEGADLLFHYLILLQDRGFALKDILAILEERHQKKS